MPYNETPTVSKETIMFHPIKAIQTEIHENVAVVREFIASYRYERMILESQAKLAETTHVPGYTKIYA